MSKRIMLHRAVISLDLIFSITSLPLNTKCSEKHYNA